MNGKHGDGLMNLLLFAVLLTLFYFIYQTNMQIALMEAAIDRNLAEEQDSHVSTIQISAPLLSDNFSSVKELHWTHMPVSYSILSCEKEALPEKSRDFDYIAHTKLAFALLTNMTDGAVRFRPAEENESPDITVRCNISQWGIEISSTALERVFVAGNTELIYTENKIINATIDLFRPYKCTKNPITQIHETLHAFGMGHTPLSDEHVLDMMYPYQTSCNAKVNPETIALLKRSYGADAEIS